MVSRQAHAGKHGAPVGWRMVEGDSVFIVVQQVIYLNLDEYLMIFIYLYIYICVLLCLVYSCIFVWLYI